MYIKEHFLIIMMGCVNSASNLTLAQTRLITKIILKIILFVW